MVLNSNAPDKWCILVDSENISFIKEFYRNHISEYNKCLLEWENSINIGSYFYYPSPADRCHSSQSHMYKSHDEYLFEDIFCEFNSVSYEYLIPFLNNLNIK